MKKMSFQAAFQPLIPLALLLTLGCAPTTVLSDCDHDHPRHENSVSLPDFGFSINGTCNEAPADDSDSEDEFLKDIEEPLEAPSSDLAVTIEEKQQTS